MVPLLVASSKRSCTGSRVLSFPSYTTQTASSEKGTRCQCTIRRGKCSKMAACSLVVGSRHAFGRFSQGSSALDVNNMRTAEHSCIKLRCIPTHAHSTHKRVMELNRDRGSSPESTFALVQRGCEGTDLCLQNANLALHWMLFFSGCRPVLADLPLFSRSGYVARLHSTLDVH